MKLEGQKVIVVGGSSGIGLATAGLFKERGAEVVIAARNRERLQEAASRLGGVKAITADGTSRAEVDRLFAEVGAFDHLVLALSGGEGMGPLATLDLQALRRGFEAKYWAQLNTLQAALPHLRKGGSVTFVTAGSARSAMPGTGGLAAINGALESMVGPLAAELGPTRVNAVSPGIIDTPWWDRAPAAQREAIFKRAAETLPVHRAGRPQDVAEAIVLVATNGFMTGTIIPCDGGLSLARG